MAPSIGVRESHRSRLPDACKPDVKLKAVFTLSPALCRGFYYTTYAMTLKQRLLVVTAVMICMAVLYFVNSHDPSSQKRQTDIGNLTFPIQAHIPGQARFFAGSEPNPFVTVTERLANPLERSPDLRVNFEQNKNSKNPTERNIALRAWTACFPHFTAPQGQAVTLDSVTKGLSRQAPNYSERVDAYRSLLGRCKNFLDLPHDDIVLQSQQLENFRNTGEAQSPGELARQYLNAGKMNEAKAVARSIITSKDAYAINSLSEFIADMTASAASVHADPELRSMAFSIAACQLGLECGSDSLTALLLCANNGACTGSVVDRYLSELPSQPDRDVVLRESRRVIDAIRENDMSALGL